MPNESLWDEVDAIDGAPALLFRETAQSYLGRLAAYFGYPTMLLFCKDFDLDRLGIARGQESALRRLAGVSGVDVDHLIRWTPVRISKTKSRIGTVEFNTYVGPRSLVKQCPLCAKEAIAGNPEVPPDLCLYSRAEWIVGCIDACERHGVRLINRRTSSSKMELADISRVQTSIYEELDDEAIVHAEPTRFEKHAMSLISGVDVPDLPLIGGIELINLTPLCYHLGVDITRLRNLKDLEIRDLKGLGFEALLGGQAGLLRLFEEMRAKPGFSGRLVGMAPNLFGFLRCHRAPDIALLWRLVQKLLAERSPSEEKQVLPQIQSWQMEAFVGSAGYDVPLRRLLKIAEAFPALQPHLSLDRKEVLVERATAEDLFAGRTPLLSPTELSVLLGRSRLDHAALPQALIDAGIITPAFVDEGSQTSLPFFSAPEVKNGVEGFLQPFAMVEAVPVGLVPLGIAAVNTGVDLAGLLRLLAGRLISKVAIVKGKRLIGSICVDPREILEVVFGVDDAVTLARSSKDLGVISVGVIAMMDTGFLTPLRSQVPNVEGRLDRLMSREEIRRFQTKYMSFVETCNATRGRSVADLAKRGLYPAIRLDMATKRMRRVVFYDRSDVRRHLKKTIPT